MSYSTHFSYGIITKIQATDRGYTKIVVTVNVPFKQKYLTFIVWKAALLEDRLGPFKVNDCVGVVYHYKQHFTVLEEIVRAHNGFDNCPICFCNLEPMDAQRIDCPGCSLMDESEHKDRISENMLLKTYDIIEYKYSSGYWLEFTQESTGKKIVAVIFKSNPLFDRIETLKISQKYIVIGWRSKDNFVCKPFEIVDIVETA